jgi:hypothetical protein
MIFLLNWAATLKSGFSRVASEIAGDRTHKKAPSVTAETVPDYKTLRATLAPRFIHEKNFNCLLLLAGIMWGTSREKDCRGFSEVFINDTVVDI